MERRVIYETPEQKAIIDEIVENARSEYGQNASSIIMRQVIRVGLKQLYGIDYPENARSRGRQFIYPEVGETSPEFQTLINEAFVKDKLRPRTRRNYSYGFRRWVWWCKVNNHDIWDISDAALADFKQAIIGQDMTGQDISEDTAQKVVYQLQWLRGFMRER